MHPRKNSDKERFMTLKMKSDNKKKDMFDAIQVKEAESPERNPHKKAVPEGYEEESYSPVRHHSNKEKIAINNSENETDMYNTITDLPSKNSSKSITSIPESKGCKCQIF